LARLLTFACLGLVPVLSLSSLVESVDFYQVFSCLAISMLLCYLLNESVDFYQAMNFQRGVTPFTGYEPQAAPAAPGADTSSGGSEKEELDEEEYGEEENDDDSGVEYEPVIRLAGSACDYCVLWYPHQSSDHPITHCWQRLADFEAGCPKPIPTCPYCSAYYPGLSPAHLIKECLKRLADFESGRVKPLPPAGVHHSHLTSGFGYPRVPPYPGHYGGFPGHF
jgi:hypothetical protein